MHAVRLLKTTIEDWLSDQASRLAAALAFYTLLSLAPLVVLAVSVSGFVFGDEAARGQIARELSSVVGPQAAKSLEAIVESAQAPDAGVLSTVIGIVTLFLGASGVFSELQDSLNHIWELKNGRSGVRGVVLERLFSFAMVLAVAFLLLTSLVLSAVLAALGHVIAVRLPGGTFVWEALNVALSFAVTSFLFALIFKVIPDARLSFRDVWAGAVFTALLFTVGKSLLGFYLGTSSLASSYGAAGSLVALVVWVYYSAQILFFGAEFTQVLARARGVRVRPRRGAILVRRRAHRTQGREPIISEANLRGNLSRREEPATPSAGREPQKSS